MTSIDKEHMLVGTNYVFVVINERRKFNRRYWDTKASDDLQNDGLLAIGLIVV